MKSFLQRYTPTIVMIPSIIGMHYGWSVLQKNRALVPADEEIELPVVTFAKYCWKRVQDVTGVGEAVKVAPRPDAK